MHVVNVLFHIANTILLFVVLARMTKGVWQSAFIAGLFALHPLHVESVAWIAERKDVLSTLFWLSDDACLRSVCRASVGGPIHRCAGLVRDGAYGQADAGDAAVCFVAARLLASRAFFQSRIFGKGDAAGKTSPVNFVYRIEHCHVHSAATGRRGSRK